MATHKVHSMAANENALRAQFEMALRNLARSILHPSTAGLTQEEREQRLKEIPEIQLQLRSGSRLMQFRELGVSVSYTRVRSQRRLC